MSHFEQKRPRPTTGDVVKLKCEKGGTTMATIVGMGVWDGPYWTRVILRFHNPDFHDDRYDAEERGLRVLYLHALRLAMTA